LVECDEESAVNKWELYDIKWLDITAKKIIYFGKEILNARLRCFNA